MSGQTKKRLGELLIEAGVIDETQLKSALGHQRQWGVRIGQALVDLKLATERDVVKVLGKKFGLEVARLDQVEAYGHPQALALVPREFAIQHNVFPLSADTSTLSVAMSDPTNLTVVDELRFRSGRRVKVTIGGDREIAGAIKVAYPSADGEVEAIALEIDESSAPGESVTGSFGGGSSDDYLSFFGADAGSDRAAPAPADDPFSAAPAGPMIPVAPPEPAPTQAPLPAPFPVSLGTPAAGAVAASALPRPGSVRPAAPRAPQAAPAPRPAAPALRAPGPGQPPPAAVRASAPTMPAMRAVQPLAGPPPPVLQPAGPARPAPRPAAPAPAARQAAVPQPAAPQAPAPRPPGAQPGSHPLEALLSPSAVQAASALRAQAAAAAPALPTAELDEELSPLPEEALEPEAPAPGALSPGEQAVLDALERLADGGHAEPEVLKPAQAIAVLIRILVRKGIVDQRELLEALRRDRDD